MSDELEPAGFAKVDAETHEAVAFRWRNEDMWTGFIANEWYEEPLDARSDWVEHVRDLLDKIEQEVRDGDRVESATYVLNTAKRRLPELDGKTVEGEQ